MKVKKFNYFRFSIFIVVLVLLIVGIVTIVKKVNYTKTYEYKLLKVGYSLDEIKVIEEKLDNKIKDKILKEKYNEYLVPFIKEKYFIYDNLDKYIEYYKDSEEEEYKEVIAIINTESDVDWFDNEKQTDTSVGELMLVNRLYGLSKDFEVKDLVSIPTKYAYDGKKIDKNVLNHIEDLFESAKIEGYTFVVSDAFRTYKEQESIYNSYADAYSKSEADKFVARPGHSEYETGLSFSVEVYGKYYENFEISQEYLWLKDNAYKYGFIFRFPKDKEDLTKFSSDAYRLRYVGVDAATTIYYEGICYEEYYAYYVKGAK